MIKPEIMKHFDCFFIKVHAFLTGMQVLGRNESIFCWPDLYTVYFWDIKDKHVLLQTKRDCGSFNPFGAKVGYIRPIYRKFGTIRVKNVLRRSHMCTTHFNFKRYVSLFFFLFQHFCHFLSLPLKVLSSCLLEC